jgi:hypothetical protein
MNADFIRVLLVCAPALIGLVVAAIARSPAIALGSGLSLILLFFSTMLVALANRGPLTWSAGAAMVSFLIRFGGAGAAAYAFHDQKEGSTILISLAACIGLGLMIDMLAWARTLLARPVNGSGPPHG